METAAEPACTHPLVEIKSTKPRSLEGAVRVCAYCGERMGSETVSNPTVTLNRETARDMLIELFYASLPEAEIGRAINLLNTVMP